jgi:hypothetical protein
MRRPIRRALLLTLVAGVAAACGSSNSSLPSGPTTLPTVLTETFAGTLTKNAAYTHPFAVSDAGDVTVFLLQSVDPANPGNTGFPLGVSLGTWNGSTCAIVIANDNMVPSTADAPQSPLTGRATAATNLCVRVYDVGFVPGTANYELLIDHY